MRCCTPSSRMLPSVISGPTERLLRPKFIFGVFVTLKLAKLDRVTVNYADDARLNLAGRAWPSVGCRHPMVLKPIFQRTLARVW
jgi:hypothetical protein